MAIDNAQSTSLNALRAFESSARHLNFTRAGLELRVTQPPSASRCACWKNSWAFSCSAAAARAGSDRRGQALLPVLSDAFDRIEAVLQQFEGGHFHEVLTVAVVGTFAVGWLMPRLAAFRTAHPFIDLRVLTHNNLVNLSADGMDFAIRFGEGLWPATCNIAVRRAADGALPAGGRRAPAHAAGSAARAADAHLPQG